jgi:hypothetical protein
LLAVTDLSNGIDQSTADAKGRVDIQGARGRPRLLYIDDTTLDDPARRLPGNRRFQLSFPVAPLQLLLRRCADFIFAVCACDGHHRIALSRELMEPPS